MDQKTVNANKDNDLKYMTGLNKPESDTNQDKVIPNSGNITESTKESDEKIEYFTE